MDCSLPGSSLRGIFRARVLEWGATAFSAWPFTKMQTLGPCSPSLSQEIQAPGVQELKGHSEESGLPGPSAGGVSAPGDPEPTGPPPREEAWGPSCACLRLCENCVSTHTCVVCLQPTGRAHAHTCGLHTHRGTPMYPGHWCRHVHLPTGTHTHTPRVLSTTSLLCPNTRPSITSSLSTWAVSAKTG